VRGASCHVPAVVWEAQRVGDVCRGLGDATDHVPEVVREARRVSDACRVSQGRDSDI